MTRTFEAIFDGTLLRFNETLDIAPNTVVRVTIETIDQTMPADFLSVCSAANLDVRRIGPKP